MKALDKKAFLADLYQRTETILEKAIGQYQNLDETTLNFSIDEKSWSIAECLSHLNSYGQYYLPKINIILTKGYEFSNNAYVPGWLGNYLIQMMDGGKNKRYNAAKIHEPKITDPYTEVAEFIAQQGNFLKYIKACEHADLNKNRTPISINKFIKLKLGDILAFMVMHNERHVAQIKRIQRAQAATLS